MHGLVIGQIVAQFKRFDAVLLQGIVEISL